MNTRTEKPSHRFRPGLQPFVIYALLLILLGASIALTGLTSGAPIVSLHLALAAALAALIAGFYMNLREAGARMRVFALAGLMWLAFMLVIIPVDWLTR